MADKKYTLSLNINVFELSVELSLTLSMWLRTFQYH